MKLTDIPVLYINLDRDTNRKKILEKDLKKLGMNYQRISAVYGKNLRNASYRNKIARQLGVHPTKLQPKYWFDRRNFKSMSNNENNILSRVGCYLSHLLSVKYCLDNNLDKVIIFEDDACPLINFYDKVHIPKNTDILYLGGFFVKGDFYNDTYKSPIIKIKMDEFKLAGAYAYLLPNRQSIKNVYNVFMSVFLNGPGKDKSPSAKTGTVRLRATTADYMLINFFQKNDNSNAYILNPVRVATREFSSNITNNRKHYQLSSFLNQKHRYMLTGTQEDFNGIMKIGNK